MLSVAEAKPQLVILGGGFAGLRALFRLQGLADITLVDPRSTSLSKPGLPEVAFAGRPVHQVRFPLRRLVERHGARFAESAAVHIDPERKKVSLASGDDLSYDYLFVALGATKDYDAIPGFREHGYSPCDDTQAPRLWEALETFAGGPVVVGSAPTATGTRVQAPKLLAACEGPIGEAMFMLTHELGRRGLSASSQVSVFSPGPIFFEDVGEPVHRAMAPLIDAAGIKVHTSKTISRIGPAQVDFEDGSSLEAAFTVVIPPYRAADVIREPGLGDEAGYLPVGADMRHLDHPAIFGAGDATALAMPKLGHIAVHQADVACAAIRREITGKGSVPDYSPEVFCIMNRGGFDATLILSDVLWGGRRDIAKSGELAHLLKWGFDFYTFHTRGHVPPEVAQQTLEWIVGH